jgi:hypothetical protein
VNMSNEPTRIVGYVTTMVGAIIGVLIAFGINIDDDQRNALLTAIGAFVPVAIVMVELIRSRVVSPAATGEAVAIAKRIDPMSAVVPDVQVKNYRQAVVDNTPDVTTQSQVDWRPPVDAH